MSTYTYTAQISDFSGAPPVAGAALRVRVRPEQEASGPDGQLLGSDIPVTVTGATATFTLVATVDTYPTTRYVLIADWVTHNRAGQTISFGASRFWFTAVPGGGDIRTMSGAPGSAVFFTPNWPSPRIPGVYVDLEAGIAYRKDI